MNGSDYPQWLVGLAADPILILVASLASIASVIITIAVYRKLSKINTQLLLRERSTVWRDSLEASATSLARFLADQDANRDQIREILVQCRPTLQALVRALQRRSEDRRRVRRCLRLVGRYLGDPFVAPAMPIWRSRVSDARDIYLSLLEVVQALNEQIEQAGVYRPEV